MHENRLSGSIPEEFGQLGTHLQQLCVVQRLVACGVVCGVPACVRVVAVAPQSVDCQWTCQ